MSWTQSSSVPVKTAEAFLSLQEINTLYVLSYEKKKLLQLLRSVEEEP